jgi:predicted nuclease with TOPRIM domain
MTASYLKAGDGSYRILILGNRCNLRFCSQSDRPGLTENDGADFDEYKKCQHRKFEEDCQKRRILVPQIRGKAEECDAVLDDLRRLATEIHRNHERAKKRRRKTKALAIPTAELEGELTGLKNPGPDQELIQNLKFAHEKLRAASDRMKAEFHGPP